MAGGLAAQAVTDGKIPVSIVARGDDALRLHKRLRCAARAVGVELAIEERRGDDDSARVLIDGELLLLGVPRTESIEVRLAAWLAAGAGRGARRPLPPPGRVTAAVPPSPAAPAGD